MQKVIHYRKVHWFGQQENLLALVTNALAPRPNVNDTEFPSGTEVCEVRHRSITAAEARLHISMHVPGAQKPVSPRVVGQAHGDLVPVPPPQGSEFTEREIAVVVRPNRVGYVISGRARTSTVRAALAGLIRLGHGDGIGERLNLTAQADQAAIQQLLEQGVDRFDLGLSLPHANALQVVEDQPLSLGRSLGRALATSLSTRFQADHADAQIDELANMSVSLTINARRKAPEAEIETLTALATEAVEADDEFSIRTLTKAKIKRDELVVTSEYSQPGQVAVLSFQLAWDRISAFLDTV
jgi:hypothetical protein